MVEKKEIIAKQLLIRLNEVEEKLKNSFEKVRNDNEILKKEIFSVRNNSKGKEVEKISQLAESISLLEKKFSSEILEIQNLTEKIKKDFSDSNEVFLKDALLTKAQIKKLENKIKKGTKNLSFKENLKILNDFEELKKDIQKKEKSQEKEIEEKISNILDKKIELKMESIVKIEEEIRKDFSSQIEMLKEEKCDRESANRVISSVREDFLKKILDLEKKLEDISTKNKEGDNLKEEFKKDLDVKEDAPLEEKKGEEEKSLFSRVIDSFFD